MTEIIQFKKRSPDEFSELGALDIVQRSRGRLLIVLAVSVVIQLIFFGDYYYTFDDSYVFHVYARNIARGQGFSFNPGEISHAATPLLTFLLAAQHYVFGDAALMTGKVMNLILSLITTMLVFLIGYKISGSKLVGLCGSAVWAFSPLAALLSSGPQDFTLFTFLICLSLYLYLFRPRSIWIYFVLSLVMLARYEGALYAGLLFLNHLYVEYKEKKIDWKIVALRILLMSFLPLLWFVYIGTHSTLLPSSGSAKLNPWALREIPHFLGGLMIFFFPAIMLAALVAVLNTLKDRAPRIMFLFIWVTFCLFFYGPFLDNRRYYIHLIPFLGLYGVYSLRGVSERYFRSFRLSQVFLFGSLALCFILYLSTILYYHDQTRGKARLTTYPGYKAVGTWLQQNTKLDASVALEEIGVIPYFADRRLVDYSGWVDLKSKNFRERGDGINEQMLQYLSQKRPDYIIINTDFVSENRQKMLATDPRLSLVHQMPILKNDLLLVYACDWDQ